jgi:hypothetical protein
MAGSQNEKILLGEAAEHLVISRLLRLGYVASQAPRTWRADDVLVDQGPSFQVKATRSKKLRWMVGKIPQRDNQIWALVDFREEQQPVVYVLTNEEIRAVNDAQSSAFESRNFKDVGIYVLSDPWPTKIKVEGYQDGWLEQYREKWREKLPPVRED